MKKVLFLTLAALLLTSGVGQAQQLYDFFGQALVPGSMGNDLTMYSVVQAPGSGISEPVPLDHANYQYTLVVSGLTWTSSAGSTQNYTNGTITIYEDASTPADYANPSTFTDGTVVLSGVMTTLSRRVFFVSSGVGSVNGNVDLTGGTLLDEIHPSDRIGWFFGGGISGTSSVEPGYDESWDAKVEPQDPIVSTFGSSWGLIKANY